jgi:hypothetical protein
MRRHDDDAGEDGCDPQAVPQTDAGNQYNCPAISEDGKTL